MGKPPSEPDDLGVTDFEWEDFFALMRRIVDAPGDTLSKAVAVEAAAGRAGEDAYRVFEAFVSWYSDY